MTKRDHEDLISLFLNTGRFDPEITAIKTLEGWSGAGAEFSDWYTIAADAPQPGYRIVAHRFELTGDRRCGSWAECRPLVVTDSEVAYQFRMQGHDETLETVGFNIEVKEIEIEREDGTKEKKSVLSIDWRTNGKKATSVGILVTIYRRV